MLCKGSVNATSSESNILQSTIAKVPREVFNVMMYNRSLSKTLKDDLCFGSYFYSLPSSLSSMLGTRKIISLIAYNELMRTLLDTVLQSIQWDIVE